MATNTLDCASEVEGNTEVSLLTSKGSNLTLNEDAFLKVFDKPVEALNVVDVYNIASSIGQEFERLTDAFGGVVFSPVMPKIIRVLEMLETLVSKKDGDSIQMAELNRTVQKLQTELKRKEEKKLEEIEMVESTWKNETRNLLDTVSTLEEDNRKLTALLTENLLETSDRDVTMPEQQASLIMKMQQQITKQSDEIRSRNAAVEEQTAEIDALQSQIQRLTNLNVEIRNKVSILEQQAKSLIEEKASLEGKLEKGQSMTELQLKSFKTEKGMDVDDKNKEKLASPRNVEPNMTLDPLVANKLVIDLNDPNRPRYTLQELQEVLNDRNQLKARCFLLEEELIYHRGEGWEELNDVEIHQSKLLATQEPQHVHESGIRRFFHFLTGDTPWRSRVPTTQEAASYDIVESELTSHDLVDPDHIRELVPDTNQLQEITRFIDQSENPTSTEVPVVSPVEEREDLSP